MPSAGAVLGAYCSKCWRVQLGFDHRIGAFFEFKIHVVAKFVERFFVFLFALKNPKKCAILVRVGRVCIDHVQFHGYQA